MHSYVRGVDAGRGKNASGPIRRSLQMCCVLVHLSSPKRRATEGSPGRIMPKLAQVSPTSRAPFLSSSPIKYSHKRLASQDGIKLAIQHRASLCTRLQVLLACRTPRITHLSGQANGSSIDENRTRRASRRCESTDARKWWRFQ